MAPNEELAGEACFSDARIRSQQDDAELSGGGTLKLAPQLSQLGTSAHELGRPTHAMIIRPVAPVIYAR